MGLPAGGTDLRVLHTVSSHEVRGRAVAHGRVKKKPYSVHIVTL